MQLLRPGLLILRYDTIR